MVVILSFAISQVVTFNSVVAEFLIQTVFMTFLLLLFGEIFPKLVARGRTMWWVRMSSGGVMILYKLFAPLSKLMVRSTVIVNKVVTKSSRTSPPTSWKRRWRYRTSRRATRRRCLKASCRSARRMRAKS